MRCSLNPFLWATFDRASSTTAAFTAAVQVRKSLLLHFAWVVDDAKCIVVSGHTRLSVCLSVCGRMHAPGCNLGNGRGCPLVVHHWADLQSMHRLRCYSNIARTRNVSNCLYSLYARWTMCLLLSVTLTLAYFGYRPTTGMTIAHLNVLTIYIGHKKIYHRNVRVLTNWYLLL